MSNIYLWQTIIPLGIGTFLIRCSFIFLSDRIRITEQTRQLFTYIPAAVLPALALPMVFFHQGAVDSLLNKERLIAFIVGLIVCLLSRSILLTIVVGLVSLYMIRLLN